ncbi:glycoside hydrolase [Plebeiibacterium sediminum]|uniref:Cellulose-binding protein n=1 Tax=Plebeiibacterium sediminum TaxID=2992112 RepID=A0AAE3SH55_9BACT|nr:glycoside hydrolase [Plebeiobacterium sediminum]MCW3789001.1 cellulose-binding protein [Plebeiobacterium sediminum]
MLGKYKSFISKIICISVIFLNHSCSKSEDKIDEKENASVSFVENSLPGGELSSQAGIARILVESQSIEWQITIGDVIEGKEFISSVSPADGGSTDSNEKETQIVSVRYNANSSLYINKQELILSSLDGTIKETIVLSQESILADAIQISLNTNSIYQTISGFGAANGIWGSYLNPSEMELALGMGDDALGLSIFRVRLPSDKNSWAGLVDIIKDANSRGVTVLASPWSPPAAWKTNNSTNGGKGVDGGARLLKEHYQDFANYINEYIEYMASNGAKVDVVSIQNEPDYEVDYEGCEYSVDEMHDFVKNYAGVITGARVVAAESFNTKHSYTDAILNDADAVNNIDIVGGHIYGSGLEPYPLVATKGKELWMTEHLLNLGSGGNPENWTEATGQDVIWDETMDMLNEIHTAMTYNWNAYIWWYARRFYSFLGDGLNGTTPGEILKRGYAMSQYSKFIRPGYVRINATSSSSDVKITAYKGDNKVVYVALNTGNSSYRLVVDNLGSSDTAQSYETSLNKNRESVILQEENGQFNMLIEGKSIMTVVMDME